MIAHQNIKSQIIGERSFVPTLCVDLDGTLLLTDLLWESVLLLIKKNPLSLFALPLWLLKGKAYFKRQVAQRVQLNAASLPYNEEVLEFLCRQKEEGREIVLATASDAEAVRPIAEYLGIFSSVMASDGEVNLSGRNKCKALEERFGSKQFDYAGDSVVDLHLWKSANAAILVEPSKRLLGRAARLAPIQQVFSIERNRPLAFLRALRVHQWVKNILLFLPLLMAHKIFDFTLFVPAALSFAAFSLCASSVYIMNDLLDLESDRLHPHKRQRPFASGHLPIRTGVLVIPVLLASSFLIALLFLPAMFALGLALYLALTTGYSFYLKRVLIGDVLVLAGLYTFRVLAGAMAVNIIISPWLLAFSMFFFLCLAFVKRYSELRIMQERNLTHASGRSYGVEDIELLRSVGSTSGYMSALVLALYINSKEVLPLYSHPTVLWLIGPLLLYWITRMWFLAHRGKMNDDPIVFTVKDRVSYGVCIAMAAIMLAAL